MLTCVCAFSGIDRIPVTLEAFSKAIERESGWAVTILVGGPDPKREGKIATFV